MDNPNRFELEVAKRIVKDREYSGFFTASIKLLQLLLELQNVDLKYIDYN